MSRMRIASVPIYTLLSLAIASSAATRGEGGGAAAEAPKAADSGAAVSHAEAPAAAKAPGAPQAPANAAGTERGNGNNGGSTPARPVAGQGGIPAPRDVNPPVADRPINQPPVNQPPVVQPSVVQPPPQQLQAQAQPQPKPNIIIYGNPQYGWDDPWLSDYYYGAGNANPGANYGTGNGSGDNGINGSANSTVTPPAQNAAPSAAAPSAAVQATVPPPQPYTPMTGVTSPQMQQQLNANAEYQAAQQRVQAAQNDYAREAKRVLDRLHATPEFQQALKDKDLADQKAIDVSRSTSDGNAAAPSAEHALHDTQKISAMERTAIASDPAAADAKSKLDQAVGAAKQVRQRVTGVK